MSKDYKHLSIEPKTNMRIYTLKNGQHIFKAIPEKYGSESVFEYQSFPLSENTHCKIIPWFALNYKKAQYYQETLKNSMVYQYTITNPVKLFLVNNVTNASIFEQLLRDTKENIQVITDLRVEDLDKKIQSHFTHYKYMHLTTRQRAYYEYAFAFGFLQKKEQFTFLKLTLKLQEYGIIQKQTNIQGNNPFASKYIYRAARLALQTKINILGDKKGEQYWHRYSLYSVDKNVVHNMCMLLFPFGINGYIYLHVPSDWHSKMMDTTEIALFDPIMYLK